MVSRISEEQADIARHARERCAELRGSLLRSVGVVVVAVGDGRARHVMVLACCCRWTGATNAALPQP